MPGGCQRKTSRDEYPGYNPKSRICLERIEDKNRNVKGENG
jgi:hypothetical protein